MLEDIRSSKDIKQFTTQQLNDLSAEIRETILNTVSKTGGHLGSNLGIVELTVALHKVFNSPEDKFIFDVSHQSYPHKLLTGRYNEFSTIRQFGGLSGFTNPKENENDVFYAGHAGSSVSTALGIATSNKLNKNNNYVVAIVGDGAFTNGMIYEAINNCVEKNLRLIIILNDNEMSISKNVGTLDRYLNQIRTSKRYFQFKQKTMTLASSIPVIGHGLVRFMAATKNFIKRFFVQDTLFECLGLDYLGPVDGHDIDKLIDILEEAKSHNYCTLVHVITKKGLGYKPAMETAERYHSVSPFDLSKGVVPSVKKNFTSVFGDILLQQARQDDKICAITAAMSEGTGTEGFKEEFNDRFFDVGIAEEHMIAFASGLASQGYIPVCALYSTFVQRVYDQIFHDVAIQENPMILALDHCGLVAGDGITHQGVYDYAILSTIPNCEIYNPESYDELQKSFQSSVNSKLISVLRYPKGTEDIEYTKKINFIDKGDLLYTDNISTAKKIVVTYGRLTKNVYEAISKTGEDIAIVKYVKTFPINIEPIKQYLNGAEKIYIYEEGIYEGGFAQKLEAIIAEQFGSKDVFVKAIKGFVPHGDLNSLFKLFQLDSDSIYNDLIK